MLSPRFLSALFFFSASFDSLISLHSQNAPPISNKTMIVANSQGVAKIYVNSQNFRICFSF